MIDTSENPKFQKKLLNARKIPQYCAIALDGKLVSLLDDEGIVFITERLHYDSALVVTMNDCHIIAIRGTDTEGPFYKNIILDPTGVIVGYGGLFFSENGIKQSARIGFRIFEHKRKTVSAVSALSAMVRTDMADYGKDIEYLTIPKYQLYNRLTNLKPTIASAFYRKMGAVAPDNDSSLTPATKAALLNNGPFTDDQLIEMSQQDLVLRDNSLHRLIGNVSLPKNPPFIDDQFAKLLI